MRPHTEPVRLIQVGAGLMGRAWLNVIGQSPDVRLVGLADLNLETAQQAVDGIDADDVQHLADVFTGVRDVAVGRRTGCGVRKSH